MDFSGTDGPTERLWYWGIGGTLAGLLLWVAFFDSHSLLQRYQWHQEYEALHSENRELQSEIEDLQDRIDQPLPDSTVERIAREDYGMKRPGETVYRLNDQ
ncbi:MAG: septum formation initiator family protein [Salinibacter sp.]